MKDSLKGFYSTSTSNARIWARVLVVPALSIVIVSSAFAKDSEEKNHYKGPKTQQVDFDESAVNGTARRPDGFLLSKKNDPTLSPLFNAKKNIEERIQKSHFILK